MASTTTQAAWTEDQIAVLECARDNPEDTPSELAEQIDDPHITAEYVTLILDGFHLPDDTDKPESEAARRQEGKNGQDDVVLDESDLDELSKIAYRCAICGEEFGTVKSVKAHIGMSGGPHAGRTATEEPHLVQPIGDTENVLRRLNDRPDEGGVVTDEHFRVLWAAYKYPEATNAELGEQLDMSPKTVRERLRDVGVELGRGDAAKERTEQVREILSSKGISFVEDTDETDEDVGRSPITRMDPEDVPVVSLDVGDTKDNTEVGGWYEGVVNNVEPYGVFVTLAKSGNGNTREYFSGLAHKSNIPSMYVPSDYDRGDEVIVERLGDGDNGNISLRMVTDPDGEFIVDHPLTPPQGARDDAHADEGDTPDGETNGDSERVRAESGNATYEGPAEGINAGYQSFPERPNKGASASDTEEPEGPSGLDVLFPDADDEELAELRAELQSLNAALTGKGGAYQNLLNRVERLQALLHPTEGEERAGEFVRLDKRLDAIEAAVTRKNVASEDERFTLHLTRDELKALVREAPEDVADKVLDRLAEGP